MTYDPIRELQEAATAVIDLAKHPNRPASLTVADRLKCIRLQGAVNRIANYRAPHTPAPWAPRVSKPTIQAIPYEGVVR